MQRKLDDVIGQLMNLPLWLRLLQFLNRVDDQNAHSLIVYTVLIKQPIGS